jgi:zona occludens toxin
MIYLVTGTPGAGKTLYMVQKLVRELVPSGRQIFHNINGLKVDGRVHMQVVDVGPDGPFNWQDFPDGSICVFDEIQRQWPAERSPQKIPESVLMLDTHRHRGFDFWCVTQSPMGIDPRLRRLVEEHHHLHRQFGLKGSVLRKWTGVNDDPRPPMAEEDADKRIFRFPKDLFAYYQSASLHTDKVAIPWKLIKWSGIAVLVLLGAGFMLWRSFGPGTQFYAAGEMFSDASQGGDPLEIIRVCGRLVRRDPLTISINGQLYEAGDGVRPFVYLVDSQSGSGSICWEEETYRSATE